MQEQSFNLLDILRIIFKRRLFILATCAIVGVVAVVTVLLMPNYYEATTSFYPASPALIDPNRLFATSESGIEYYGTDDEVNQLLSAAESKSLLDYMVKKFDLYTVYDIDSTKKKAPHKVRKKLSKRYSVLKNVNDGIDVSIEDTDPKRAAAMANTIREKIDEIHSQFLRVNQEVMLRTHERSLKSRRERLAMVADSMQRVMERYQIYNVEAQSEFLSSYIPKIQAQLASATAKLNGFKSIGKQDSVKQYRVLVNSLESQLSTLTKDNGDGNINLESLRKGMGKSIALEVEHEQISKDISYQEEIYLRFRGIMSSNVSSLVGVEPADIPLVKSRPRRSLIVIGTGIITFVLCVMGVLIYESYSHINWGDIAKPKEEEV